MKKVKLVLWIVIVGIFGLVIYQNQDFLLADQSLGLDFYFAAYRTIPLPTAVLFAAVFFFGFLIAYVFGLANRYRFNRQIKSLQQTIGDQRSTVTSLTKERDELKAGPPPPEPTVEAPQETTDPSPAEQV